MGGRYTVTYSLGICSLEIQTCEMSDAGRYVCIAENSKGSLETSSKITIDGKCFLNLCPLLVVFQTKLDSILYSLNHKINTEQHYGRYKGNILGKLIILYHIE